ncbi:MAG: prepilin-type N-terminal cleavage/methylation domain-containing protein [Rhodocyclaceae bacterium]|nr:prepilin-type N-terminal cleavage/methylation domain-containing protein [Opitutaceae bacterium]MCL4682871.1 prepilin-type N-terminal cleavage/methylation domain-containing protein [Rhodocyclaceae bacterium]
MIQGIRSKQKGFTITELMLVLGVAAVIIGGAFIGYKNVSASNTAQQNQSSTTNLVVGVKTKWQGIGSYAAVTPSAVNDAKLLAKPLTWDSGTTTIRNAYDKTIGFAGAASHFVAQVDVPADQCLETIGSLDGIAYRIDVHTAARAAADAEHATYTVKAASGSIDSAKANTQCGGATTVVTAYVK